MNDNRPVEIWIERLRDWFPCLFENLKPFQIVRFDYDDSSIFMVMSYPFKNNRLKLKGIDTIIVNENLYFNEDKS